MNLKQKLFSSSMILFLTSACSSSTTNTKQNSNTNYFSHYLNRVGYITTKSDVNDNLIKKTIDSSSNKYKYRLDGSSDLAFKIKQNTTRVFKADKKDKIIQALKILEKNRVGLVFVEGSSLFNREEIYDAIKIQQIYTGRLVIFGDDIKHPKKNDGSLVTNKIWHNEKIATFEYSKIISAYMTGYLTQTNFGLTSNGTKKSVSYLLGVAYEPGQSKKRKEDIKKAIAFKKGIEDAVKEQKTGEVYFVPKPTPTKTLSLNNLIIDSTILPSVVEDLAKDKKYLSSDHSFTYFSGSTRETNYDVAHRLTYKATKNKYGHKVIVDTGATDNGYGFEFSSDVNVIEGEEGENPQKNATARVGLAFNKDLEFSESFEYAKNYATKTAIENVLKMIFKDDKIDNYFNKYNRFGTFGIVMQAGRNTISPSMQKARNELRDTLLPAINEKKINEDQFAKDDFFGKAE